MKRQTQNKNYTPLYVFFFVVFILGICFLAFSPPLKYCDERGCKDKNGCYINLKENVMPNVEGCLAMKGYHWDECQQRCALNQRETGTHELCNAVAYQSFSKAENLADLEDNSNLTIIHFCEARVIANNESCNKQEEWEYIAKLNKCAIIKFT